ncbi:MAG TPA: outer membrane beta-barrel protein [Adhaeribacter sp.]|nr:outer membrane beta-barrel protein [Adhaeribacter sp.]
MISIKKLTFAFFVFALFYVPASGQTAAVKMPGTWAVGLVFSPDVCYRTLSSDADSKPIVDFRNQHEIPKFGFTTGASVIYGLNNRVLFESGLLFSDKGEIYKSSSKSFQDPAAPVTISRNYHYYYLDVPAKVNYYVTTRRVKLFVSAGTSTNLFLGEKLRSTYEYADGRIEKKTAHNTAQFSRVNLAALAGFGVDFELADNLQARVEPIYRRSITSIINAPIKGYLYSAGVNFGVYYKL